MRNCMFDVWYMYDIRHESAPNFSDSGVTANIVSISGV